MSYLKELEDLSRGKGDGGLLHGGHIHFIQGKLSDEDGFPFLKAAIYGVLERVPDVFPPDLPELAQKDEWAPSEAMVNALDEIQNGLIMPIGGYDVIRVILAAREYEKLARGVNG